MWVWISAFVRGSVCCGAPRETFALAIFSLHYSPTTYFLDKNASVLRFTHNALNVVHSKKTWHTKAFPRRFSQSIYVCIIDVIRALRIHNMLKFLCTHTVWRAMSWQTPILRHFDKSIPDLGTSNRSLCAWHTHTTASAAHDTRQTIWRSDNGMCLNMLIFQWHYR